MFLSATAFGAQFKSTTHMNTHFQLVFLTFNIDVHDFKPLFSNELIPNHSSAEFLETDFFYKRKKIWIFLFFQFTHTLVKRRRIHLIDKQNVASKLQ